MAPQAVGSTLSNLIGSDSEDEFQRKDVDALLTPDSAVENATRASTTSRTSKAAAAKSKPKSKAAQQHQSQRVTKSRGPTRRDGNDKVKSQSAGAGIDTDAAGTRNRPGRKKRVALAERPNLSDTEEVDDIDPLPGNGMPEEEPIIDQKTTRQTQNKRGGRPKTIAKENAGITGNSVTTIRKGRPTRAKAKDVDMTSPDVTSKSTAAASTRDRAAAKTRGRLVRDTEYDDDEIVNSPEISRVVPETQQDQPEVPSAAEDVGEGGADEMEIHRPSSRAYVDSTPILPSIMSVRKESAAKSRTMSASAARRRAGSASDTERGSDSALRRKLGEMTTKFENMELKYRNLRELGLQERETNFERLKRAMDERSKAQEAIISSLKQELATQKSLANEAKTIRSQLAASNSDKSKVEAENKRLSTSFREAQTEAKGLSAKLAAARQASVQRAESAPSRGPGSATKGSTAAMRSSATDGIGKDSIQLHALKEELYRDLTDLVVLGVKQSDGEIVYDCIQTGRNGTLHFHLSTPSPDPSTKPLMDYQDAEFDYTPLLDEKRDRSLLEILPDFLTEEIQFPRSHAAGFYTKLFENMKRKIEADVNMGVDEMDGVDAE